MNPEPFDLEKLLKVPLVDPYEGFEISPDGVHVAFSWNATGAWEIYELPLDLSTPPRQITGGPGGKFSPCYSPDGARLAYVLDLDGGEVFDIIVFDRVTQEHTNLTPDTPDAIQPNLNWSPDGRHIAFISNRSDRFDTYVMPSTGGAARQVLSLPHPDWDVHWSPDGRWLAVVSETHGQDYGVFIVPAKGGETRPIADERGPLNARDARWSPDGARIAFYSDPRGVFDIGVYEMATGQVTWLTDGDGDKESPFWSPDGQRLAYVLSQGPLTWLAVLEPGGAPLTYQVEPGVHYMPRFTPDGAGIVFVFDSPRRPDDLWLLSLADGSFRQLTRSLPAEFQDAPFVMPDHIRYPALDETPVPALLYQPTTSDEQPAAVVVVHGGPNWLFQFSWNPLIQHMLSRGWVVLAPNYRGSTGYGRQWQLANRFDLGGVDTADVVAGANYLARHRLADPDRIAVTGRSHGGYLTMTCLTQYPQHWAAGSAVVPFLNWFTAHANSREDLQHWDIENFGDPEENRDLWRERSPFFFLDRIQSPVQLICGANDPRCPASESIAARDELLAQGRPVDFALYPDEGHHFLKIENVIDSDVRRINFLAQAFESKD